jgi:hypothetical protein
VVSILGARHASRQPVVAWMVCRHRQDPRDALVSRRQAREYEGLWMKEPQEFLFDPLTRARRYLQRFPAPPEVSARAE